METKQRYLPQTWDWKCDFCNTEWVVEGVGREVLPPRCPNCKSESHITGHKRLDLNQEDTLT